MTVFNAIDTVYNALKSEGLNVYKLRKPQGDNECIVINALPLTGSILRRCYVNVNVYVKDLIVPNQGSLPNTSRLKSLGEEFQPLLTKIITKNAHLYLDSDGVERDEQTGFHYINFRLLCNLIEY